MPKQLLYKESRGKNCNDQGKQKCVETVLFAVVCELSLACSEVRMPQTSCAQKLYSSSPVTSVESNKL